MDNVKECLKKCRLYCFNSRNGIKNLLNIPKDFDLENHVFNEDDYNVCYEIHNGKKSILEKQAGNSIVVNVLMEIFKILLLN